MGLAVGLVVTGCATPDATNAEPKTPTGDERDTELKHEKCDFNSPAANRIDVNGDGKPDIIHVMEGSREVCRVVDLNLDGAIDAFIYYDAQGLERRRESDFDRDGRPDEITYLEGGVVTRKERETNFDNKLDTWDYYAAGRIIRRERDSDGDGIIDQWWQFNNPNDPRCAIVASDRNADGKPDPDSILDLCGQAYGAPTLLGPPAPPPGAPMQPGAMPPQGAPPMQPTQGAPMQPGAWAPQGAPMQPGAWAPQGAPMQPGAWAPQGAPMQPGPAAPPALGRPR